MTEIVAPALTRPPKPTTPLPPNYQWVWVEERTDSHGKVTKPHWRKWPIKMRNGKKKGGRPPKAVRPQFTGQVHASHVYDQLAVPLAFFAAMPDMGFGPRHETYRTCIEAITNARTFINRFIEG